MKIGQTAKLIDTLVPSRTNQYYHSDNKIKRPAYFGLTVKWNDKRENWDTVNSTYIAQRYAKIIEMIKDANAQVKIQGKVLKIIYSTGYATIAIDDLVKKILIPELSQYIVND